MIIDGIPKTEKVAKLKEKLDGIWAKMAGVPIYQEFPTEMAPQKVNFIYKLLYSLEMAERQKLKFAIF